MNRDDLEAAIRDFIDELQLKHGFSTRLASDVLDDLFGEYQLKAEDEDEDED